MKTLGVLGGMGPLAGAYFYRRVIENTSADKDAAHVPVVLLGDPRIPDRTAHLLGVGEDPYSMLLTGVRALESLGASLIAIPCNTAHAYLHRLNGCTSAPILDMPYLALMAAVERGARRIGLLSTRGTLSSCIYHRAAAEAGVALLTLPPERAGALEERIYAQKGGLPTSGRVYKPYAEHLLDEGAEAVILGCTEISAAFEGKAPSYCVDALEILARTSVAHCTSDEEGRKEGDVFRAFVG